MIARLVPLLAGIVFALGLGFGGLLNPSKIIGFLDVFGNWDPTLLFVMASAVGVFSLVHHRSLKLNKPFLAATFARPSLKSIDAPLLIGAIIFGIGWGAVGYCPGPSFASLTVGGPRIVVFVAAMFAGFWIAKIVQSSRNVSNRSGD